jgi:hypothetical protein
VLLSCALLAQTPKLNPNENNRAVRTVVAVPTISFDLVFPNSVPSHYAVSIQSTGKAAYRSNPEVSSGSGSGDPYIVKFTASEATSRRIFELTKQADFFKKDFDYKKTRIANTGNKTLTYTEGPQPDFGAYTNGVRYQTTYVWSQNPAIQELTAIFNNISNTMEAGRRLEFDQKYDKLGLDAELKQMENLQKAGQLAEVQAIAPTLRAIAADSTVMHIARASAQKLLAVAQAGGVAQ